MAALRTGTKNINATNAYQNDLNLLWCADGQEEISSRKIQMFQSQDFVFTILKNGRLNFGTTSNSTKCSAPNFSELLTEYI